MIIQNRAAITPHITTKADVRSISGTISGNIRLTCMFASFVFLQFTVLGLANHAGEGFLTTGQRELVYYALQVFVILGFLLHAAAARIQKGAGIRKGITYITIGLLFVCVAVMLLTGTDSLFYVIICMIAALCLGGIGGAAHLRMSLETLAGADVAKCMGIGSAAAVVLQYLLQIRWGVSPLLLVFMLGALLLMAYFLPVNDLAADAEIVKKTESIPKTSSHRILLSILITVAFVLFACFYNEYIHHLQIQSDYVTYTVYSWPRLMLVPGYLLFAFIGDRKKGRYVPVASLCIMLIALLNVVLVQNPGSHWLNMCLFYFSIATFTSYYLLTFWRLAPGTGHPALWAPFGRIIDSGMVLLAGAINFSAFPAPAVLAVDIVGVIIIILLMLAGGDFNLISENSAGSTALSGEASETTGISATANPSIELGLDEKPEQISESHAADAEGAAITPAMPETTMLLSPEETINRMQERYKLSPRETEVLREVVLTEDKQAVISQRLGIRIGTLQAYVTRLYRKTGTKTRSGLLELYHNTRMDG